MLIPYEEFKRRADALRAGMDDACRAAGRSPADVSLLAVTKTHPAEAVAYVTRYGLRSVGENRVQEAVDKQAAAGAAPAVSWELIGHLQSNKAALAARHFDRVQSVDTVKLARRLGAACAEIGKTLPVLLQINAGDDPAKFGAAVEDGPALLEAALGEKALKVEGLMTIAPLSDDPAVAERTFARLRALRETWSSQFGCSLPELSMGMTGDYRAAIAAGSTIIRVGTALFGAR